MLTMCHAPYVISKRYPNTYAGIIERIPIDKNWLLGMAVTGVLLQSPRAVITMPILAAYLNASAALSTTMNTRERARFQRWLDVVRVSPVAADVNDQFAHVPNYVAAYVMDIATCASLGASYDTSQLTWTAAANATVFQSALAGFFSVGRRPAHMEPLALDYLSYHLYHRTLARAGTLSPFVIPRHNKGVRGFIARARARLTRKGDKREARQYNRAIRSLRRRNLKLLRKVGRSMKRGDNITVTRKQELRALLKSLIVNVKRGFQLSVKDVVSVRKAARQLYRQVRHEEG